MQKGFDADIEFANNAIARAAATAVEHPGPVRRATATANCAVCGAGLGAVTTYRVPAVEV